MNAIHLKNRAASKKMPLKKSPLPRLASCATALYLAISSISVSYAQSEPSTVRLEEVVVTANRREASLQDIAASISAITASDLSNRGITSFDDINRATSGIYLESTLGSNSASVRVRGVGSRGFSSITPSVGVLVDGIYQTAFGAVFTEMLDIDRVEVLRGPQGTLFGKNTTAGVIHVHTKNPVLNEYSGTVQGVLGNFQNKELRGVINLPILEDTLAIRMSGFRVLRDGYMTNKVVGEDTRNQNNAGGRFKALWTPVDSLEVTLSSEFFKSKARADDSLASYGTLDSVRAGDLSGAPLEEVGLALGKPLPGISKFNRKVYQDRSRMEDEVNRSVLSVKWQIPYHTLTSLSAYEEVDALLLRDGDSGFLNLQGTLVDTMTRTVSQELLLSSELDGPLQYVLGAYYHDMDQSSEVTTFDGTDLAILEDRALRAPTLVNSINKTKSRAAFTNLTYEINERFSFSAGTRYTEDKRYQSQTIAGLPVIPGRDRVFRDWTYTTTLSYHIDPDKMLYTTYGSGFKSGGFNRQGTNCFILGPDACLAADQLQFDAETTDSYEIGWKTEWFDNRVRFNGAVFIQQYDDYQVTTSIPTAQSVIVSNAAEVESKGIELDLFAALTEHWSLNASLAHINSKYKSYKKATCPTTVSKSLLCSQDLSGKRLDNAPKWSGNIGIEYRADFQPVAGVEWFGRVDASFQSSMNLLDTQNPETFQGGYTLWNARTGIETLDGTWQLTVWGKNLTNKEYATVSEIPSAHSDGLRFVQGLPRTYGVTLDWRF